MLFRSVAMKKTLVNIEKFLGLGVMGFRRFGSAALDLCYIAAGRADAFFEIGLNAWDFAAGAFIAQEAGALVTGLNKHTLKAEKSYVTAANPAMHKILLEVLLETEKEYEGNL